MKKCSLVRSVVVCSILVVLLTGWGKAAEITGPASVKPGLPVVFELPVKAAWTVTPVDLAADKVLVDSGGTRIFFASPVEGTFTVIAAYCEGEVESDQPANGHCVPSIATHTFIVSGSVIPVLNAFRH